MATVQLELPEAQVIDLVQQLSPESKHAVLQVLIPDLGELEALVEYGSARIRTLCAERGIAWDTLSEEARARLVDDWMHESL